MTVRVNKSITINGITISLVRLINHSNEYIGLLKSQFSEKTFKKKQTENYECYLKRLFALIYRKQNNHKNSSNIDKNFSFSDCSDLCFEITKRNEKSSRITFKESGHSFKMSNETICSLIDAAKRKTNLRFSLTSKFIGVEFEFIGDPSKINEFASKMRKLVGNHNYTDPLVYCHNNGNQWILGKDSSVKPSDKDKDYIYGMTGFELTSPILRLSSKKDMTTLDRVCELIKNVMHGYTNKHCGTHIHMSFPIDSSDTLIHNESFCDNKLLCHFVKSYRESEDSLFDKLVPLNRRLDKNEYCRKTSVCRMNSRYAKLNVTNCKSYSDHLHLEFRQLDGTIDSKKIISWARLQTLFIDSALKSWKIAKDTSEEPIVNKISLEDIVANNSIRNIETTEQLMMMAKMIA